jgi:hypothetical protein
MNNPISILKNVFGNSWIFSVRIKYIIGIIENPKMMIDLKECFISK